MAKDRSYKNRKDGCNSGLKDKQRITALLSITIPALYLIYTGVWMCI